MNDPMKIGIIGCGKISGAYFGGAVHARNLEIKACADLRMETAEAAAAEHGCAAMTVDRLLADPEIELVVNLTISAVHVEVGIDILAAGKHVYAEKPLAIHGTEGSIEPGDPNNFKNPPKLFRPGNEGAMEIPFTHADNKRMIGVVDMVDAIRNGRPHRAGGELAFHVLEVMEAFDKSSESGLATRIESTCERPEALPSGLLAWEV